MSRRDRRDPPLRLAAPAPEKPPRDRLEAEIHNLCVEWVEWSRTRRRFGAPGSLYSVMSQLTRIPGRTEGLNGPLDARLQLFDAAVRQWPEQDIGRQCFELQYLRVTKGRKKSAGQLGIDRSTYYRKAVAFARAAYRDMQAHLRALQAEVSQ